ncbi:uncharacterized protein LOC126579926 [Anopheles aquasalis]|uniref:uncharacterized protein LOC126579926 n=1 Tax=Anopheles aquasalis TaxID=42839 RepID=UPI00215A7F83|nr:uncharacterized protein LOC126579926 [Anopheles aquasalis]
MIGSDAMTLPQGNLCYTAEYQVQSECWADDFVKSEVEVRSEIVDPTVRICTLCGSLRNAWQYCFTSTGQLTMDQERLSILRLVYSVVITFEATPDAVFCDFCCHKLDEMIALHSIWPPNSTAIEQQPITPAAINNVETMVSIPADAIKQEPSVNNVATEASQPVCSYNWPRVLLQKSTIGMQKDAIVEQEANDRKEANNIADSPVIEEPPSCLDGQQVPADGMSSIDVASNDGVPTIDLTCCEVTSRDGNSEVDEEKDRLIRKVIRLIKKQLKAKRFEEPKKRRSKRLRNATKCKTKVKTMAT